MRKKTEKLRGLPISPGIAIGRICLFGSTVNAQKRVIGHNTVKAELDHFEAILASTRSELEQIKSKVEIEIGRKEADIFDLQILLTRDPTFITRIEHKIAVDLKNLAWAVQEAVEEAVSSMTGVKDAYLQERASDIRDIGSRMLEQITNTQRQCFLDENEDVVIAAEDLFPSQTVQLQSRRIGAFITEHGGATGHAAILARSLGVPLVSGILDIAARAGMGDRVIVDGFRGEVILNPSPAQIERYSGARRAVIERETAAGRTASLPSVTRDRVAVHLYANIGSQQDLPKVKEVGAEGVGLYRTELHFINREKIADEEEQYRDYSKIAASIAPGILVIRTIDIGGDKFFSAVPRKREPNPYLGMRAIRLSLRQPDVLKTQLRAIYRAANNGAIKLLLPMISSLEEVHQVKKIIRSVLRDLKKRNIPHKPDVPLGLMVEVPSVAINILQFLDQVDFISVGTNDLIQYTLAVDRGNETVSSLYQPFHPAVLSLLAHIGRSAKTKNIEASVCGEIAADPLFTELLIGFGFRNLSMSSPFIPHVKLRVRQVDTATSEMIAQKVLAYDLSDKIRRFVDKRLHSTNSFP